MEIYNKTISRPLADLHFHPANPRDHSEESTKRLAESIKEDPTYFEAHPILLSDRTGELVIIGGEGRCRAARFLGMTEAPTFLFEGLTEEDEVRIMQKDNSHTGKWDDAKLVDLSERWGKDKIKMWSPEVTWKTNEEKKDRPDLSEQLDVQFRVEITCADEREQENLFNELSERGYQCRILTL